MKKVTCIILFNVFILFNLIAQWERIDDNCHGFSYSNAENKNTIYSCFNTLWKSTDDGLTFKEIKVGNIPRIEIKNEILFILKSNNISVSKDSGNTWVDAAYDYLYFDYCVNNSNNILSMVDRFGLKLIFSKDFGKSWIDVTKNLNLKDSIDLVHKIYTINNDFYYYDTNNNELIVSKDDCKTWKLIIFPEVGLRAIINDGKIFLIGDKKLYYSIVDGESWIKRTIPETPNWLVTKSSLFIAQYGDGRLLKSNDFGVNWELLPYNKDILWPDNNNRQIFINSKGHFFANGFCGYYYSHDGGYTWGKSTLLDYGKKGSGTVFLDAIGNKLFTSHSGTIVTSDNEGVSWSGTRNTEGYAMISFNKDSIIAYNYTQKMYYSKDKGDKWNILPYNTNDTIISTSLHKGYVYYSSLNNGIHRSNDEGKTWEKSNDIIFYKFKSNQKSMLGLNFPDKLPYLSNDDGKTWKLISLNEPTFRFFSNIFLFENLLVIMTEENIFVSKDNGVSWKSIINNLEPLQLIYITDNISYINNRLVIAGSGCPVYISDELLSTWYPIGENLLFNTGYGIVHIGDTLFLTNPGGLYKRSLSEILIKVANKEITASEHQKGIGIYPNPVQNILNITVEKPLEATIFTIDGKEISTQKLTNQQIDVSTLQSGSYLLKVKNKEGVFSQQFVKL